MDNNEHHCCLFCTFADIAGIADSLTFTSTLTKLYLTCRHSEAIVSARRLTSCIDEIAFWLASNRLMLNPAKTDLLWCTCTTRVPPPTCWCHHAASMCDLLQMYLTLAFCSMRLCLSKRMSLSWSVVAMAGLRIRSCRRALTQSATITLVS